MTPLQSRDYRVEPSIGLHRPVRVLLIDDSIFTLHGLRTFLSEKSNIAVVGTARTEAEAFSSIQTCRPDVVILEVKVGSANGINMCKIIRGSYPHIAVLFFSADEDKDILHSAILAGAQGYLLKNASGESVAKSIEIVSAGQAIMDQQLTQQVLAWVRDSSEVPPPTTIESYTNEDRRILSLVTAGKTNKEIAQELNVMVSIVTTRLQRIYKRLKISRRSEAARYFTQAEKHLAH
ncbi:MAG: response regulator transcription factor [Nitrospira sp.]